VVLANQNTCLQSVGATIGRPLVVLANQNTLFAIRRGDHWSPTCGGTTTKYKGGR
jgi:hypothetical protein